MSIVRGARRGRPRSPLAPALVVSSWGQSAGLVIDPASGAITTLADGIASPADRGIDASRSLIIVPDMLTNWLLLMPTP